jgi:hypothetical protein
MQLHQQFDKFFQTWLADYLATGRAIYCRKGCAGCCNLAVHATWPEAAAAAAELTDQQAHRLNVYSERLLAAKPELTNLKSYLKLHRQALGPCPFLSDEGACSIYTFRPLSCRALLSTRPADWCVVDFSELSPWDKQAFESSLDRQVVAWPSHYVAATQDFARALEETLMSSMRQARGWAMSGNFALMVWLAWSGQLDASAFSSAEKMQAFLDKKQIYHSLLLKITTCDQQNEAPT